MMHKALQEHLLDRYVDAKEAIIREGFESEIVWQQELDFVSSQESDFLREAAWVILSSGMREKIIREKFPVIEYAFFGFSNATEIVERATECRLNAMSSFGHPGKIDAIISLAVRVAVDGFESIKTSIDYYGIEFLQSFDFIGPATSCHLAKNMGLHTSKPDRHLVRVAESFGFESAAELCEEISRLTGDSVPVIDLVIWRFATIRSNYLQWFTDPSSERRHPGVGVELPVEQE